MSETALEPQAPATPVLAYNANTEITAEDLALPRLKVGQSMTAHVQDGAIKNGAVFTELSKDDPDAQQLSEGGEDAEPVRFYVIGGPIKGWSYSNDGELETWAFDDPNRHPDAWKTYKYLIAVPDHDEDIPYSFLLTRSGMAAARQINTVLARLAASGPASEVGFDLTTKQRENDKGRWFVPRVAAAPEAGSKAEKDRRAKHQEIIGKLLPMAQASSAATSVREPEPAI